MTVSETQIEAGTRAVEAEFKKLSGRSPSGSWAEAMARAALTAALSNQAVVPKEPTPEMLDAAYDADAYWLHDTSEIRTEWMDEMSNVYRAMIAAAPPPSSTAGEGK